MGRTGWLNVCVGLLLAPVACGDDAPGTNDDEASTGQVTTTASTEPSTTEPVTTDATTGDGTTTDPTTGDPTTGDPSSESGFLPPVEECGNGFVEGDEQCDDANDDDGDSCNNGCRFRCGLQWSALALPPTGQSTLDPRSIVVDSEDNVIVVAFQREITADQKGNQTLEPDDVLVAKYDPDGAELWAVRVGQGEDDVSVQDVTVDAQDNIYLAATVRPPGLTRDIWAYKLASGDGSVLWNHAHDSAADDAADEATGIVIGMDGNPVVVGQVSVADGDDDIFVRSLDEATGEEIWTSTWTGPGNGVFSTDNGGRAAVGADGTVYVFGQEYISFQSLLGVVVAFPAAGGDALWTHNVEVPGGADTYAPLSIGIDAAGDLTLAFRRISGATNDFFVQKLASSDRTERYTVDVVELEADIGDDWSIAAAASLTRGGAVVAGSLVNTDGDAVWSETWVSQLDADGVPICQIVQAGPTQGLLPASLAVRAVTAASNGGPIVSAQLREAQDEALWVGRFATE